MVAPQVSRLVTSMTFMSASNSVIKDDDLVLVVGSSAALAAAGLDVGRIAAVTFLPVLPSSVGSAPTAASSKIRIGRLKTFTESDDEVRLQVVGVSEVLKAIGQMSVPQIATIINQLFPFVDDQHLDRFKHEYGVLTIEEMADQMRCTPEAVREREVAGDIFAAHTPSIAGGQLYPKFQLSERVDKSLLKRIIQEYREAGVSTTLLWSFLRGRQKEFAGFTPMEMMLGASAPAYDALTLEEWGVAFLEVVSEELSRVRWIWGSADPSAGMRISR